MQDQNFVFESINAFCEFKNEIQTAIAEPKSRIVGPGNLLAPVISCIA